MAENLTPATQARLAAEMARMLGLELDTELCPGKVIINTGNQGQFIHGGKGGLWSEYNPFTNIEQAVAFADWAEREGHIHHWERSAQANERGVVDYREVAAYTGGSGDHPVEVTPDTPFPAALSLAVCRAVPQLREIMEASDD